MRSGFIQKKILDPLVDLLKQGITPEKIALSLALGIVLGVFPVIGSTTLLCAAAAFVFRLNLPAIQLVNYLVYPLQIGLLIPFYRAGEILFGAEPLPLSVKEVLAMIEADVWGAILFLWDTTLHAMVAWLLVSPIISLLLYSFLKPAIKRLPLKAER